MAAAWYLRAARQGDADAQNNLGAMFDAGEGVLEDDLEAMHWYRLAANQGNSVAQNNLGALYFAGTTAEPDLVEAHKWFLIAEALGSSVGGQNKQTTAMAMSETQIDTAEQQADEWLRGFRAGIDGDLSAGLALAASP